VAHGAVIGADRETVEEVMFTRRHVLLSLASLAVPTDADASDAAWAALSKGGIILFRHANAPGTGDPPGFRLGDCATQRNLDDAGRAQARRIGSAFRSRNIQVGRVLTSQWCRCVETASLAFPGQGITAAEFNSFFDDRASEARQTEQARTTLKSWAGSGALVVVTHQVNITALTGVVPASGEGVVVGAGGGRPTVIGRIRP
jgi:phosphohistidine phosphatase SixA